MTKLQLKLADTGHSASDDDVGQFKGDSQAKYCRLSNRRLQLPIVSDYMGHLYNKEAVLEWLLTPGREDYTAAQVAQFSHIRRLDDVVELQNLTQQGESLRCESGDVLLGDAAARLVYLVPCGDVVPKPMLLEDHRCPKCGANYQDVVTINPSSAKVIESLKLRIARLQQQMKHHNGKPRKSKPRKSHRRPTKKL